MNIKSAFLRKLICLCTILVLQFSAEAWAQKAPEIFADVVVFTASPAGITSAVAAAREGSSVVLVEPTSFVGGIITNGGLTSSDLGDASLVGGLSRGFFSRVADYYRKTYGRNSIQLRHSVWRGIEGGAMEPRVAGLVFEQMLSEYPNIKIIRNSSLQSVQMSRRLIHSLTTKDNNGNKLVVSGKVFIDASYTGDLMALSKASYLLGTESKDQFGEEIAPERASPAIQAYNYRITITNDPINMVPVSKPKNYNADADTYMIRLNGFLNDPSSTIFRSYWRLPNKKQDANIADWGGKNWNYPEASAAERKEIEQRHREHSLGFLYFLQNDPRVPKRIKEEIAGWGLAKDEFADNGNFPRQIYVREARRLNGEYVMRQSDLQEARKKPDAIAIGNYPMDSHATNITRQSSGKFSTSGGLWAPVKPYEIAYRALVPKRSEVSNLLVPVCLSATHIAWTSIRMEPVFMMTGEAAGIAASLAATGKRSVQKISVETLQQKLTLNRGLIRIPMEHLADFEWRPGNPKLGQKVTLKVRPVANGTTPAKFYWDFNGDGLVDSREKVPHIWFDFEKSHLVSLVVEDTAGRRSQPVARHIRVGKSQATDFQIDSDDRGNAVMRYAKQSMTYPPYWGKTFSTDSRSNKGKASGSYTALLKKTGLYAVYVSSVTGPAKSRSTPVIVQHASGTDTVWIDQQDPGDLYGLIHVGDFKFTAGQPANVTISNSGTKNYVVFDVVRWVLKKESAGVPELKSDYKNSYQGDQKGIQAGLFAGFKFNAYIVENFGIRPIER